MRSHLGLLARFRGNADEHWPRLIGKRRRGANKLGKVLGELAPIIVLVGLCIFFFGNVLFTNEYFFPWDMVAAKYPLQHFVSDALHSRALPLWDPFVLAGYPIVGAPQASIFYPFSVLAYLLPGSFPLGLKTVELVEVLHIGAAGVFTYILARALNVRRSGAFLGGLVFMLSGFFPMHVEHENWVKSAAWTPLLLLLTMQALKKRSLAYASAAGVIFGIGTLAGHAQTSVYTAYLLVFFLAWHCFEPLRRRQFRVIFTEIALLFVTLALGLGVSAILLLPASELLANTTRYQANFAVQGSLSLLALSTLFLPQMFGSAGNGPYLGGEPTLTQIYLGLVPLMLFALSWLIELDKKHAGFFRTVALLALALSFGPRFFPYRVFAHLPFVGWFRRPWAFYAFFIFGVAILVGMTIDRLIDSHLSSRERSRVVLVIALCIGLCILYISIALAVKYMSLLIARYGDRIVISDDLSQLSYPLNTLRQAALKMLPVTIGFTILLGFLLKVRPAKQGLPQTERRRAPPAGEPRLSSLMPETTLVHGWTKNVMTVGLVVLTFFDLYHFNGHQIFNSAKRNPETVLSHNSVYGNPLPGIDLMRGGGLGEHRIAMSNYGGAFRNAPNVLDIESLGGRNPLLLRRYLEFLSAIPSVNSRLFDLLNVKYVVTSPPFVRGERSSETFAHIADNWERGGDVYLPAENLDEEKFQFISSTTHGWYQLYENLHHLPRFFATTQYQIVSDPAERLATLGEANFDPGQIIVLEEPFNQRLVGTLAQPVKVEHYGVNGFTLKVDVAEGDVLLFMSEIFYPGWYAYIDGKPAHIYIADHTFRALHLTTGQHTVQLVFRPRSFELGAAITTLSSILAICIYVWHSLRRRRWGPERESL